MWEEGREKSGCTLTFRRVVQKRKSPDFRSPEAGISGEEVDLTIACMVLCIFNRHELQKDRERIRRRTQDLLEDLISLIRQGRHLEFGEADCTTARHYLTL